MQITAMNSFGYVIELSIHLVQVLDPLWWLIYFLPLENLTKAVEAASSIYQFSN